MRYDSQQVHDWVQELYQAYGFEAQDAQAVAKMITYTDLHGIASHGIQRLSMYDRFIQAGKIDLHAQPEIVFETHLCSLKFELRTSVCYNKVIKFKETSLWLSPG